MPLIPFPPSTLQMTDRAQIRYLRSLLHIVGPFSKLSVTSPTSQLILQPFRRFTYVTVHSPTLPLLHRRHSSFSNPSFASPTSQALHLRHLAIRSWYLATQFLLKRSPCVLWRLRRVRSFRIKFGYFYGKRNTMHKSPYVIKFQR